MPAGSLSGRPVDKLHTGGAEGPVTHKHNRQEHKCGFHMKCPDFMQITEKYILIVS